MFGRSKTHRSKMRRGRPCTSCGRPLAADAKLCECGHPTSNMSFEERARYEVERWRAMHHQHATA